jgi:hypothetical protein
MEFFNLSTLWYSKNRIEHSVSGSIPDEVDFFQYT